MLGLFGSILFLFLFLGVRFQESVFSVALANKTASLIEKETQEVI
jgi:hypothetical protein